MPDQCRDSLVEQYIAAWETGLQSFADIEPDQSKTGSERFCKTMDDEGNIFNLPHCDVNGESVTVGYIWKELFDGNSSKARIGVTIGKTSDHNPHFHDAPECYYVTVGKSKTLA